MPRKRVDHTHRYERGKLGKDFIIYRCVLAGCAHYIPANLLKGRVSICPRCNDAFEITADLATLAKPHCKNCYKRKKPPSQNLEDAFAELGLEALNENDFEI